MAAEKPQRYKQRHQEPEQPHADVQPVAAAAAEAPPTSRLCIKNIPKHLTDQRLKDHFAAKGQVTDVKVLKTR
jgi:RNA recognition motif-containing protein